MWIRGVQKNGKVRYKLADKLIPILWGIIRSTGNFKFCSISKKICCIPEVLTLLMTPILKYIYMPNDICHIRIYVINDINDIYDMYVALTYTICMYVNIGFKRSVRTSGVQPIILDILQN